MNNQLVTPEMQTHHNHIHPTPLSLPTLLNNLPGMAYRCQNDENWTMDFVSDGAEVLTGYPVTALVGNTLVAYGNLIHAEDQPSVYDAVQLALQEQRPFQVTYRIRDAHGNEKWVWEQGQALRDENGEVLALEGFITDITPLRQTENALRESEARFRTLIQSAKDGVILGNEKGLIVGWNTGAANIFGYEEEEILGKSISLIMPERYRDSHQRGMTRLAETGEGRVLGRTVEMHGRRKDGSEFPLEIALNSWVAPDGSRYFNGMVRDITERKAVEAGLVEYTKQLQTAADLAQQINNILDPDLLLQEIVQQLQSRFALYHVHVYLLDETGEDVVVRAGSGDAGATLVALQHRISLTAEHSIVVQAARSREIVNVPDVRNAPNFLPNPLLPDTRSEVAVPLVASSQLIGVLDIQDNITNRFSTSELDVFRALSGQIATTLENSKLFRQVESNLAETQSRLLVTEALASAQSEAEVLDALVQQGSMYRDTSFSVALWVPNAEVPTLEMRRSTAFESGIPPFTEGAQFAASQFPVLDALSPTEVFVSNDISNDERYDANARAITDGMGAGSAASIPLNVRGEWLGALVLISPQVDYFDEHKLFLYRALAEQGAESLIRAQLRAGAIEAQRQVERERSLLTQIMSTLPVGVFVADPAGVPIMTNEAARNLLGRGIDPSVGAGQYVEVYDVTQEDGTPYPTEGLPLVKTLTDQGRYAKDDIFIKQADGQLLNIFVNSAPIYTPDQQFMGGVVSFTDISLQREAIEERVRYTRQLQTAAELAGRIASILDLDLLLAEVVSELQSRFDLYHVHAYLLDHANQRLVMAYGSGEVGAILRKSDHQIPLNRERSLVARAARSQELVVVHDVQEAADFLPNPLLPETRSEVSVPLIVAGQVLGVLDVQDNQPNRFTQGDLDVFRTLAGLVATALQNADLFKQVEINLAETENRLRVSQALSGAETEAEVLDAIIRTGGFYRDTLLAVALWLKDSEIPTVEVVRSNPYDSGMPSFPDGVQFTVAQFPMIALLDDTVPFVSANIQKDERVSESSRMAAEMMGQQGAAIIPMKVGGEWVGGLVVASTHNDYFDTRKMSLYLALADQGSDALTRARLRAANTALFKQVETNLAETENRLRVTEALAGADTEAEVLDAIITTGGFYRDTLLAIALWVEGGNAPTVEVVRSNPYDSGMPSFPNGVRFTTAEFPMISLLSNTEPFVSADMQTDMRVSESSRAAAQMLGQAGAAIIPMNVGGAWIGGLVVASTHNDYFDERKMSLYLALAEQGSEALTRARLRAASTAALEALSASEARYRTLADNSVDMISRHNAAGDYTYVSPAISQLLGYQPEEILGRNAYEFIVQDDQSLIRESHDSQLEDETSRFNRYRIRRADGTAAWVESVSQSVFDDNGILQEIVVVTRGVDAQIEVEQERRRYTRQLQTAAELAGRINTILDLEELLTETVSQLQSRFDLYHVHIYLRDEISNNLVMLKGSGPVGETLRAQNHSIPSHSERSLVARAARSQEIVVVNDVAQEAGFLPNPLLPDTQSEVAIPLISAGRVLGVLDVQDNEANRFAQAELDVLRTLAGLIATSLQNAELYQQVEQSLQETRLRLKVSQAFAATQSERDVHDTIFDLISGIANTQASLFTVGDMEGERYSTVYRTYTIDPNTRTLPVGTRFKWNDFAMSKFIESRDTLFVTPNAFTDSRVDESIRAMLMQTGATSFAIIPIRLEKELFAFITTSSQEENAFNEETIQLYQIIAERGALATREARLYDAVQNSLKRTNIRFAVSQALAQARTEDEVLDALIHQSSFISGAHVTISTFDPTAEVPTLITRRSANFESPVPAFPEGLRFTRVEFPIQALLRADEAFISNNLLNDSRVDAATLGLVQSLGVASGALFPLTNGSDLVGVVNVLSEIPNFFADPASAYLYESLAEQGSVALRAARLFDETQETAERLKELDRLKSEFLANMSHELRTPLNSIIGYAEIMLMGINGPLGDENVEDVNAIRTSGQHLLRLINDILDLAKIEAGRMSLDTEEVNVAAVLDEIRVAHLALIHKKDIQLHVAVEPLGMTMQADRLRLHQILTNLISNAVKFTEKGHVMIRAKQDNEEWMRIEVEDTGVGIDPENLEAIFEEFRQADGSSTRRAEGTGLGLAITRRLVQMHGGIITVESTVDKGSIFTVRLPMRTMASYLN
jgi:PAS domain S-box-containing protein